MSTKYFKAQPNFVFSDTSDYAINLLGAFDEKTQSGTLKTYELRQVSAVITTGTTIDLGLFTTVTGLFVQNLDTTNFVEVRYTDQSNTNKQKLAAGDWMWVPIVGGLSADLVIIADTAACLCDVLIVGT